MLNLKRFYSSWQLSGPRKLRDIMQLSLIVKESPQDIDLIWRKFHEEKLNAASHVLKGNSFETLNQRINSSPMFIFPVKKPGGHFMLISQKQENTIAMTFLEDFKKQRLFATPFFMLTFYQELQELKDRVLIRGETMSQSITKNDAQNLLQDFLRFYVNDDLYNEFVQSFNQDQNKFSYEKFIKNFDLQIQQFLIKMQKEEKIKVAMRCRPLISKEIQNKSREIITIDRLRQEVFIKDVSDPNKKPLIFTYDLVYDKNNSQLEIYNECARPIVEAALQGFNCTIFAYGQTGTGKTFTMEGNNCENDMGIIPRTFNQIFERISEANESEEYMIRVSMLEIYNEKLKDSLSTNPQADQGLEIHGDSQKGFYVKNLETFNVSSPKEMLTKLDFGKSQRQVRATEMNDYSSRSHSIFTVIIESSYKDQTGQSLFRIGKLNLVDLAGSEKTKQTKTTGEALKEGIQINLSLTNLINVINLLVKGAQHIPYRDSKLTKLLADSLGGNSKTVMIANIGPSETNYQETLQTLKYANRAKQIKNKPVINEDAKDAMLRQKQQELEYLKKQIQQLGLEAKQTVKTIDNLTVQQDENKFKEHQAKLDSLKSEELNLKKEKQTLEQKIAEQQKRLEREESEKQQLILKFKEMSSMIITKKNLTEEIQQVRQEINQLRQQSMSQEDFLKSQRMLQNKQDDLNKMTNQSKQLQDQLFTLNTEIQKTREKITMFQQNKNSLKQTLQTQVKNLQDQLNKNRLSLKKQIFFLQNLIPKAFIQNYEEIRDGKKKTRAFEEHSMYGLRKPLSLQFYCLNDSYINPYFASVNMKKQKEKFVTQEELYEDPKVETQVKKTGQQINLRFLTQENGQVINFQKENQIKISFKFIKLMKKKVPSQVRQIMEEAKEAQHRGIFVIMGDRAKDQVVNLVSLWRNIRDENQVKPKLLWCFEKELGFSSHQEKRRKEVNKLVKQGLYEKETQNPFENFLTQTEIRYCYYKETQNILGQTFDLLILQDFHCLTPNILCQTIETIKGGGMIFILIKQLQSLQQIYTMTMNVHERFRTDAFQDVVQIFNERLVLSLANSPNVLFLDDELNLLPISEQQKKEVVVDQNLLEQFKFVQDKFSQLVQSLEGNKTAYQVIKSCKTFDQAKVVLTLMDCIRNAGFVNEGKLDVKFVTAGRGRGKSAALGLSIASALVYQLNNVFITASGAESIQTVFEFIEKGLEAMGYQKNQDFKVLQDNNKSFSEVHFYVKSAQDKIKISKVIYVKPGVIIFNPDLLIIDEAAAIPTSVLKQMIQNIKCPILISSTIHGYEGTGRSLSLKLVEELRKGQSGRMVHDLPMEIPIRYGINDPIENWMNSLLCLDTNEQQNLSNSPPSVDSCKLYLVNKETLFSYNKSSEAFLKKIWSLFVTSHYKNTPNDLQLFSDAPAHCLAVLLGPLDQNKGGLPDVLVAIQFCFEGQVNQTTIDNNDKRGMRPAGDLVPWSFQEQFQQKDILHELSIRVVRIATHKNCMNMGYASKAIQELTQFFSQRVSQDKSDLVDFLFQKKIDENQTTSKKQLKPLLKDPSELNPSQISYISVSFGLSHQLLKFWMKNKFQPFYL